MSIKLIIFLILGGLLSFANIIVLARGIDNDYLLLLLIVTIVFIVGINLVKRDKWIFVVSIIAISLSAYDVFINGVEHATNSWVEPIKSNKDDTLIEYYFSLSGSVVWIAVITFFKEIRDNRKQLKNS